MGQTRDQLVCHLQSVISERQSEAKTSSAVNLTGALSQHKMFRDWLANNYRSGGDLKRSLLALIKDENQYFGYDLNSGFISNKKLIQNESIRTLKPLKTKFLADLESNSTMDFFDDDLRAFELVLFLVSESLSKSWNVSDLKKLIGQKCDKEFKCYKAMINAEEEHKEIGSEIKDSDVIRLFKDHLNPLFSYSPTDNTVIMTASEAEVFECLNQIGFVLLKKSLFLELYRSDRRFVYQLNDRYKSEHKIFFDFMFIRQNFCFEKKIYSFGDYFSIKEENVSGVGLQKVVRLWPRFMDGRRLFQFELMYKYGIEIRGITGKVLKLSEESAVIESEIDFCVTDSDKYYTFKVVRQLLTIYGFKEVSDLMAFIHCGDRLKFDIIYIPNLLLSPNNPNIGDDLWVVSRIYSVRHSAKCFANSLASLWSDSAGNWTAYSSASDADNESSIEDQECPSLSLSSSEVSHQLSI